MKKLVYFFIVGVIFVGGKLQAQTTTITTVVDTITEGGLTLYNAHNYKESIVEFNKSIKANPKNGKAFYYRGLAKMHDGQKGFCKDLEESVTLGYSTSADVYYYGCETFKKKK